MTRPYRYLTTITNTNSSSSSSLDQISAEPPEAVAVESDFVVILAALLCALICVLGLIAVARCAWLRRGSTATARRSPNTPAANKGMKKKTLESFPKFVYGEGKNEEKGGGEICMKISSAECVICLTEYVDGDEIRVLPQCGHGFHVGCIDTWLGSHSSCPSCRQILVSTRCRKCGEFPAVSAGEGSTERKDGRRDNNNNNVINHDNSSSGSSEFLP